MTEITRMLDRLGIEPIDGAGTRRPHRDDRKQSGRAPGGAGALDRGEELIEFDQWPDPIDEAAFHGPVGEIVKTITPHTEADPVALLAQVLVAFGNVIGRHAHFAVEADAHYGNLFACLVGSTAKGRKGTSWGHVRRLFHAADEDWGQNRIMGGLSSGEGLIWHVRDPIFKQEPVREGRKRTGRVVDYEMVEVDPGESDKRVLILEPEFGSVLRVAGRERNTLTAIMRQAWDTGNLRTLTKNSPVTATDAHVSIVGHITKAELRRHLSECDMANGMANRYLWLCVRRSKCLPEGGQIDQVDLEPITRRLAEAVEFAATVGLVERDEQAREVWRAVYPSVSEGKPGLLGAVTSRAEAQVMRVAMIYALLDKSAVITAAQLVAALAVWKYAEASARYIFGSALGDKMADEIMRELRQHAHEGLDRSEIRELFHRNKRSEEITEALEILAGAGMARREMQTDTGGRPREVWFPCSP